MPSFHPQADASHPRAGGRYAPLPLLSLDHMLPPTSIHPRPTLNLNTNTYILCICLRLARVRTYPCIHPGCSQFLELWAQYGGSLELLATTADDADDMPGAELREDEKGDFLDFAPSRVANVPEEEDEELVDDGEGEDSEVGQQCVLRMRCRKQVK